MKALIILTFIISVLSSCKKDYTCACGPPNNMDGYLVETKIHDTKKGAKQICDKTENPYKVFGPVEPCFIEEGPKYHWH